MATRRKGIRRARRTVGSRLESPTMPPRPLEGNIADRRAQFQRFTRSAVGEPGSERVFLASKLEMLRSHPSFSPAERLEAEAAIARTLGINTVDVVRTIATRKRKTPPVPGGVGYGMFYTSGFRTAFARGTSFYYEIVCPHQPGGMSTPGCTSPRQTARRKEWKRSSHTRDRMTRGSRSSIGRARISGRRTSHSRT